MNRSVAIAIVIVFHFSTARGQSCSCDSVITVKGIKDCHRYEHIYIKGKLTKGEINQLNTLGISQAINLRTDIEINKFTRENFDENAYFDSLGISYFHVPLGDGKNDAHPDKYGEIASLLNNGEKTILYCKSGTRAAYVFMHWLIREKNCPEKAAKDIARDMGLSISLDLLLGNEIKEKEAVD